MRPRIPELCWDLALGAGILVYLALDLFAGLESPLVGFLLVAVVGRRLIRRS